MPETRSELPWASWAILIIRRGAGVPQILFALRLAAHAGDPADYADRIDCIP